MSADPAEILPPELVAPQAGESDVAALMARGRVESRIAANLKLLEALQHVPESTCADQRDRLTGEIGTLTVLLGMPDDELVAAAPDILRTSKSRPPQNKPTPPVVLYEVLPVQEGPDEAPTEEANPDIYTRISRAKATFLDLIQHASTLPEEEVYRVVDAINDACDETYAAIGQFIEDIESVDQGAGSGFETGELTEVERSAEPPETFYDKVGSVDSNSPIEEVMSTVSTDSIGTSEAPITQEISSLLPPDFREQVLALVNATPTIYIKDIIRNIFGTHTLDRRMFSAQYNELQMMIEEGLLQPRGPKGFSLPEEQRQQVAARRKREVATTAPPTMHEDKLSRRLKAAGIPASPTTRPRRKGHK